jgi:hypothetical protein
MLDQEEISEVRALIAARQVCVLSSNLLAPNTPLDHEALVEQERAGNQASVLCMSPTEYRQRRDALQNLPRQ